MRLRPILFGRLFTVGAGLAWTWAAAVTLAHTYDGLPGLRSFRWPLFAGEAAILALLGLLAIAGGTIHIASLVTACTAMVAFMIAHYDSESSLAPAVGLSTAALAYIYVRFGMGSVRVLAEPRRVALALSVVFAVVAMAEMQEATNLLEWQRVRTPAGGVELRTFISQGRCSAFLSGPKDIDEIDSGCEEIIPARRAGYVIGFSAAAAALALVAVVGAPSLRRLSDGMLVPPWT